jgi:hypothetical protein
MTNITNWHIWLQDLWVQGKGHTYGHSYKSFTNIGSVGTFLMQRFHIQLARATFFDNRHARSGTSSKRGGHGGI